MKNTRFLHISPVLPSLDVARDVAWWKEKLGFRNVFDNTRYEDNPLEYAVLERQGIYVHLQMQFPKDMDKMYMAQIRIQVENIEPLYEELKAKGVAKQLRNPTAWGTKEFGFYDLNRNGIFFYEAL
jgi:hypothetical protein